MAVPFMSLYVIHYLHKTSADAGIILTLFGVGAVAGTIVSGKFTDKWGFRPVQIGSLVLDGAFFITFSLVSNFAILLSLAFFMGFFTESFKPANFTAVAAYAAPGTETRSYCLNRLAMNLGWAIGVTMGGIVAYYNYQLLFIIDGSFNILAAAGIFILLPDKVTVSGSDPLVGTGNRKMKPWHDGRFMAFVFFTLLFNTVFFLFFRIVPLFLKEIYHLDESVIGITLGVNGLIIGLFEVVLVNHLEGKRSIVYFIVLGSLLMSGAYLLLLTPPFFTTTMAMLFVAVFTVAEMLAIPFMNAFVVFRTSSANLGLYAAAYTLCLSVAQVAGPGFGFFIISKWGYDPLWITLSILLFLSAVGYKSLPSEQG